MILFRVVRPQALSDAFENIVSPRSIAHKFVAAVFTATTSFVNG